MMSFLSLWLTPWEPFASLMACMAVAIVLYLRGRRRVRMGPGRQAAFWTGMALIYFFQLTHFDYYAEHEFFLHRLQQLVLHHAAPLLIVLAYPGAALRAGIPLQWRVRVLRPLARSRGMRRVARIALNPALVTIAFIVSILVWLIPSMQTMAMLDWRVYRLMNASMLVSGFAYWWLVLDHRPRPPARMPTGLRVISPAITMFPQILAGAFIALSRSDLYPIFSICGRALALGPQADQQLGGLIIWIPASIVEATAALLAMRRWMRLSGNPRCRKPIVSARPRTGDV
ncbi:MAG TPA: cytochrome c oxidase assembly protein [Rhodanobacteraceae bacterium]|nr:cytochrome c oxidase assembly protein [Rhodanobacteraceae bacterium]